MGERILELEQDAKSAAQAFADLSVMYNRLCVEHFALSCELEKNKARVSELYQTNRTLRNQIEKLKGVEG